MALRVSLLAFLLAALGVLLSGFATSTKPVVAPPGVSAPAGAADRHVRRFRLLGLVLGATAAIVLWDLDSLGRGAMLAAVGFGLAFLAANCFGELTSPVARSVQASAEAVLHRRRVADYLPRGLSIAVGTSGALLAALLCIGISTASIDDLGRPGRVLTWAIPGGAAAAGPWPGSFYAGPLLVALLIEVVVAWLVLRVVALRAQVVSHVGGAEADAVLRRAAVRGVVAAVGVATALPLLGVAFVMATVSGNDQPGWLVVLRWVAAGSALAALATFAGSSGVLLRSSVTAAVDGQQDELDQDAEADPA